MVSLNSIFNMTFIGHGISPTILSPTTVETPTPESQLTPSTHSQDQVSVEQTGSAQATLNFQDETYMLPHVIKRGETLSDVAKTHLGDANRYIEIYRANKDQLRNPNDLRIGMTVMVPVPYSQKPPPAPTPRPKPVPIPEVIVEPTQSFITHTVKRGESLSIIALKLLNDSERYMDIYRANRDQLNKPNAIQVGMVLKIPVGDVQPSVETPSTINTSSVDVEGMTSGAKDILGALQRYQSYHAERGNTKRTRTTSAEMVEIAIELDKASQAFGVDPKMMLAVFAHESGGFNPRARSHTGAGGLGQLTGIAIRQVHYMAGMAKGQTGRSPYTQYKSNFVQRTNRISQRYNIKANVWTSTAYMSYELNDRKHLGRGVENALKRYGDPNVSTYADKVNREFRTLFGGRLF